MKMWTSNNSFAFVLTSTTYAEQVKFLKQTKIPWWKGGGYKNTFVHSLLEATMLSYHQALDLQKVYEQSPIDGVFTAKPIGII